MNTLIHPLMSQPCTYAHNKAHKRRRITNFLSLYDLKTINSTPLSKVGVSLFLSLKYIKYQI